MRNVCVSCELGSVMIPLLCHSTASGATGATSGCS
jgi:hypothetical protein